MEPKSALDTICFFRIGFGSNKVKREINEKEKGGKKNKNY